MAVATAGVGKRERLVQAAIELFHRQGVEKTTLAHIAAASEVPIGNIYYYFKTKDALLEAVIESHVQGIESTIESLAHHRSPKSRLKELIRLLTGRGELIAQFGCPHGTLCSELEKTPQNHDVARLMSLPRAWLEDQFRALGRRDARALAITFLMSYQGTAVLTHTLRDPTLLTEEGKRLERWVDSL